LSAQAVPDSPFKPKHILLRKPDRAGFAGYEVGDPVWVQDINQSIFLCDGYSLQGLAAAGTRNHERITHGQLLV
jgi:hypothetical protein